MTRALHQILLSLREFCDSYVDDMSVFSVDSWEQHLTHLNSFLQAIKDAQFTLSLNKCHFALPEVTFVGHVMGSGKHGSDPEEIRAVENLTLPRTKSDLRRIMGLFSCFCSIYTTLFKLLVH